MVDRNEDVFSYELKKFIIQYINANESILRDDGGPAVLQIKHKKWRYLIQSIKAYGVVTDCETVCKVYWDWKQSAKNNIMAFRKWGNNVPANLRPNHLDFILCNISHENFENIQKNHSVEERDNNRAISVGNELPDALRFFVTPSQSCHRPPDAPKCTEYKEKNISDNNLKVSACSTPHMAKMKTDTNERSQNIIEQNNIDIPGCSSQNVQMTSANDEVLSSDIESVIREIARRVSSNEDTDNRTNCNREDNNFRQQRHELKLAILRARLKREKEENEIKIQQWKIKLQISKIQLKRERMRLMNARSSKTAHDS